LNVCVRLHNTVEPAYKDMLWISDLTRKVEVLT
jgi:hypothetical protein